MEEIRKCPHCGSMNVGVEFNHDELYWYCGCKSCLSFSNYDNRSDAVANWNRRDGLDVAEPVLSRRDRIALEIYVHRKDVCTGRQLWIDEAISIADEFIEKLDQIN